jgi:serine/threonine-protein kinase
VTLYVSKGQNQVTVPKLTGTMVDDASTTLTGLKLTPAQTDSDSLQPKGTVIDQSPVAGSVLPPGGTVTLTVSTGPKPVEVPDVRGQDQGMAVENLKSHGLTIGHISTQSSMTVASGTVISTDPAANTQSTEGTAVDMIISTGFPKVVMPNVIGESPESAASDIQTAGLVPRQPSIVQVTDPQQDGVVIKTSPKAGITPRQGSRVIIVVGQYTPPGDTTTTDTNTTTTPDTTTVPPTQ